MQTPKRITVELPGLFVNGNETCYRLYHSIHLSGGTLSGEWGAVDRKGSLNMLFLFGLEDRNPDLRLCGGSGVLIANFCA